MIKTVDGKDFDNGKTYYKVTNEEENHHGLQYHDGLNEDPIPFNCDNICSAGGIYFTSVKHIFEFLNYGYYIREITIPDDALVYQEDIKYKASKLIFGKRMDFNLDTIKYLVENGADIHKHDDVVFKWAADHGHLDIVKYLVENGADIHACNDCALRWTAEEGHLDVVKYLVENGADIHACDDSALICCVHNGHLDIVKYLLEKGADIHTRGDSALENAAFCGNLDMAKCLVENGADIHECEALKWAIAKGNLDIVSYFESLNV